MRPGLLSFLFPLTLIFALLGCDGVDSPAARQTTVPVISGRIEAGLRVLTVDPSAAEAPDFTIYRGDYVRLETPANQPVTIVVADLGVAKTYPVAADEKTYFKVPNAGRFAYTIGELSGVIEALDYAASGYREVSAAEADVLIRSTKPLILDVRTPGEFDQGHLAGAKLIPVQVLQAQIAQLGDDKQQPLFIYCRSGNRSTVAARLLMDRGFTNVVNLRRGLKEWQAEKLPLVK